MVTAAYRYKPETQEGLADLTFPELEETESADQITDDATLQSTEEPSQAIVADKAESQPEATAPTKKKKKEPTCTEASIPKDMYIDNFFDRVTGKAARDVLVNHGGYSLDKLYEILQKYDRDYSDDPLTFFRDLEDKTEETATDQFYQRYLKTLPAMAAVTQVELFLSSATSMPINNELVSRVINAENPS